MNLFLKTVRMKKYIIFNLALVALILTSCGNSQNTTETPEKEVSKAELTVSPEDFPSDPVTIEGAVIEGNIMTIKASYSGGCAEHEFKLLGLTAISKSIPPQRQITLSHNANGDNCREYITEELSFEISAFGIKEGDPIVLQLAGWSEDLTYTP